MISNVVLMSLLITQVMSINIKVKYIVYICDILRTQCEIDSVNAIYYSRKS